KMNRAAVGERTPVMESTPTMETQAARLGTAPVKPVREGVKPTPMRSKAEQAYAPPTHALIGVFEQAGFGLRYGAWMFDFLITLIAIMSFTFLVTAVGHHSVVDSNRDMLLVAGLTLLLFVLNFVVLAGLNGQSAGMRILGIQIARTDGKRFTMGKAALRH